MALDFRDVNSKRASLVDLAFNLNPSMVGFYDKMADAQA
jgi:hypothetical protein